MKAKIHPKYDKCVITCSCGNIIETRGTRPKMSVDICSACHPFFTGKQKLVDAAGRVEKFRRRFGETAPTRVKKTVRKAAPAAKRQAAPGTKPEKKARPAKKPAPETAKE